MTMQHEILNDENYIPLYEHGFVGLVDSLGNDSTPAQRARMSYGKGTKSVQDNRNLLRYLTRLRHTSPIEMVELVFHIKLPIFVMRQHVRHRTASLNEYSGRYSEMSDEFYTPMFEDIALQSVDNKQGRIEDALDPEAAYEFTEKIAIQKIMGESYQQSYEAYQQLLEKGLARELARTVLPVANYTECFWKIDLHNFFHYSKLRRDSHAQKEIRAFADALFELVERQFPLACEAFNDYIFEAVTFSRMEMNMLRESGALREVIQEIYDKSGDIESICNDYGITKREWEEFQIKINGHVSSR